MPRRWIVNASPLILLGKIGRISLLGGLADEIWVPTRVAREVAAQPDGVESVRQALEIPGSNLKEEVPVPLEVVLWDLGPGESQVLALAAQSPGSRAVVDDLAARRCGQSLAIQLIGTLGIILRAARVGAIPAARPVIEELRRVGLYASERLIDQSLARLGE